MRFFKHFRFKFIEVIEIVSLPRSYRNNEGNRANATREVIEALNKADAGEEKVFNKKASRASVGVYQPGMCIMSQSGAGILVT